MAGKLVLLALLALACSQALAYDPSPLQDFCVADMASNVFVNGFVCKNPNEVAADNFFFSGLDRAGNTTNPFGSNVTTVNVKQIPGLNTLGMTLLRGDFAPNGLNPPHIHPRASEILTVLEGTLYVGFVTSNSVDGSNRLVAKTLNKGDVFAIPQGLIHFQFNLGNTPAVALVAQNSQLPGVILVGNSIFGSNPPISDDVLGKAFRVDNSIVDMIKAQFQTGNNNY